MALAPSSPPDFAGQDAALVAAHARLVKAGFVQLGLPGTSDAAPKIPEWLQHLGEWLGHRPVGLRILFWAGVAALVLIVGKLVYDALSRGALDFRAKRRAVPDPGWWRPDAARAKVFLAQADGLAEAGRFDEAAHLLLLKSVDDIDERRPGEMRPSLTARDIARLPALPGDVARAFGLIAGVVETSLFGGAVVAREAWNRARDAYAAVAIPRAWA